jgi:NADH-quinone oxidoreductase subunit M
VLVGTFVSGQTAKDGTAFGGNLGPAYAIPAATGVILGAVYLLYWAGRVVFGPLKEPAHEAGHDGGTEAAAHAVVKDLSLREWLVLLPVAALVVYMGVYPKMVVDSLQAPVNAVSLTINGDASPIRQAQAGPVRPATPVLAADAYPVAAQ